MDTNGTEPRKGKEDGPEVYVPPAGMSADDLDRVVGIDQLVDVFAMEVGEEKALALLEMATNARRSTLIYATCEAGDYDAKHKREELHKHLAVQLLQSLSTNQQLLLNYNVSLGDVKSVFELAAKTLREAQAKGEGIAE